MLNWHWCEHIYINEVLKHGSLITLDEIHKRINTSLDKTLVPSDSFIISVDDYFLGLADLTGELMRYCTNCVTKQSYQECFTVCQFVQIILTGFKYSHLSKDLESKATAVDQNMQKIEKGDE
eukprot:gene3581-4098_t